MYKTWVLSLDLEDPLEKEMATHSSMLAWEVPWTEKPGGLQSMGSQRIGHNCVIKQQQQNNLIEKRAKDLKSERKKVKSLSRI